MFEQLFFAHYHLVQQVAALQVRVAAECDVTHGMLAAFGDLVGEKGLAILRVRMHVNLGIEVSLLLKIIPQVALALEYQIRVN